ncbi:hypothetical protein GF420_16280 [candidate division GN15 bacterium]|nr:hypothetical protein [candidate division GN15 bacterium]
MPSRLVLAVLSLLIFTISVAAQSPDNRYFELQQESIAAYQAGDFEAFRDKTLAALKIKPRSVFMQYNAACGLALTGKPERALRYLRQLAERGIGFDLAGDGDFDSLRDLPEYRAIASLMADNIEPVINSDDAHRIEQADLVPEGITWDPDSDRLFVGSMRFGRIYAIDPDGQVYQFAHFATDQPLACLGVTVDTVRNLLWAVATAAPLHINWDTTFEGLTGVYAFDLATGETRHRWMAPDRIHPFGFNDLAVAATGDIYLTGSKIFHIPAGDSIPIVADFSRQFAASNGAALSPDQRFLFVGDNIDGIARVELSTGTVTQLEQADSMLTVGIDGMYYVNRSLVAVQNGAPPWRVSRFFLNTSETGIDSVHILERANPDLAGATTGVIVRDSIYYVGRYQRTGEIPQHLPVPVHRWFGPTAVMKTALDLQR